MDDKKAFRKPDTLRNVYRGYGGDTLAARTITVAEASSPSAEVVGEAIAAIAPENFPGGVPGKMVGAAPMSGGAGMSIPAKPIGGAKNIKDAKFMKCDACGPVEA